MSPRTLFLSLTVLITAMGVSACSKGGGILPKGEAKFLAAMG